MDRLDVDEFDDAVLLEPAKEVASGTVIGQPGVLVADRRCEETPENAAPHDRRRCAIAAGTASELCIAGVRIGAATSMTAGTLARSPLMPPPDQSVRTPASDPPPGSG